MSHFLNKLYEHGEKSNLGVIINSKGGGHYRFSIGKLDPSYTHDYDYQLTRKGIKDMERAGFTSCLKIRYCSLPYNKVICDTENEKFHFCFSILKDYIQNPKQPEFEGFEEIFKYWVRAVNWIACFEYNKATPKDYFDMFPYLLDVAKKHKKTAADDYREMEWNTNSWNTMSQDVKNFFKLSVVPHAEAIHDLYLQPFSLTQEDYQTYRNFYTVLSQENSIKITQIKEKLKILSPGFNEYATLKETDSIDNLYKKRMLIEVKMDYHALLIAWGNTKLEVSQIDFFCQAYVQALSENTLLKTKGLNSIETGTQKKPEAPQNSKQRSECLYLHLAEDSLITPQIIATNFLQFLKTYSCEHDYKKTAFVEIKENAIIHIENLALSMATPNSINNIAKEKNNFKL